VAYAFATGYNSNSLNIERGTLIATLRLDLAPSGATTMIINSYKTEVHNITIYADADHRLPALSIQQAQ
jgi:hypothetical protein